MRTSPRSSAADLVVDRFLPAAIGLVAVGIGAFAAPGLAGASVAPTLAPSNGAIARAFPSHGLVDLSAIESNDEAADAESAADDGSDPAPDPEGVVESGPGPSEGEGATGEAGGDAVGAGEEKAIEAVVIDPKRRTVSRPKVFAASKLVKVTGVTWKAWGSPTATGRGRVVSTKKGRRGRTVRATGTVVLSALRTCPDATPLYRRATIKVAGRKLASVSLPGCSELR